MRDAAATLADECGPLVGISIVRRGVRLLLGAELEFQAGVARLHRIADLCRFFPPGPVQFELVFREGESFRFIEFAENGEPTSRVIQRWYDRMTREHEVPPHVRQFLDFAFLEAMEQWDTETC